MSMDKAELMVRRKKAEFIPGTNQLHIYRENESELIRMELAARARRDGERNVDRLIQETRFSAVSWSGSSRKHLAPFERDRMAPVVPGTARS